MDYIDVHTGQVAVRQHSGILKASALGSCVALALFEPTCRVGSLAHIMLPGRAPDKTPPENRSRYAHNALYIMLAAFQNYQAPTHNLTAVLVGAGNVLRRPDDSICRDNINSLLALLHHNRINIDASDLGGFQRRSLTLDIAAGTVSCSRGDDRESLLWRSHTAAISPYSNTPVLAKVIT